VSMRFLKSVTYSQTLEISTHVDEWRAKVFVQVHRVLRNGELMCEGREVRTFVKRDPDDPERLRSIPVPDDIRALCA
jgi:4-hydroxybenzoyl-CoA thioesterase